MTAAFPWYAVGGEAFASTLTAQERRVIEALDPAGRMVPYATVLRAAWPGRTFADTPTNKETQMLRAHRSRLVPKLASVGLEIVTQDGYGVALRQIGAAADEGEPVRLGVREARWALKLASWMAEHAQQPNARAQSRRLANALGMALHGIEDRKRAQRRKDNATYKARHAERQREYAREAARRYRAARKARMGRAA